MQKIGHNIGFLRKTPFFAENWRKSQKIVIITSTPGHTGGDGPILGFPRVNQSICTYVYTSCSEILFKKQASGQIR
jgi:hypothetical protein